jgi:hypothetical protein
MNFLILILGVERETSDGRSTKKIDQERYN